jgi:hypothetical protein
MLSRLNPAEPVDVWRVMSPTSYQAAPPRRNIITHSLNFSAKSLWQFGRASVIVARRLSAAMKGVRCRGIGRIELLRCSAPRADMTRLGVLLPLFRCPLNAQNLRGWSMPGQYILKLQTRWRCPRSRTIPNRAAVKLIQRHTIWYRGFESSLQRFGSLKALKNSLRNCRLTRSVKVELTREAFERSKNSNAWDMGPLDGPQPLGAGRFLSPIGRRENFGYKSLQRCGSGVPWRAWLEHL